MFDTNNLNEIFATDQQMKTRSKKNAENPKKLIEKQKEQEKTQKKLSKLSQLEEDDYREEDADDSDYEGEIEESTKKDKKKAKKKTKNILFGKINLSKYFDYDPDNVIYDFPNYTNIIVKPKISRPNYKICNVCFNFANYTCKHCGDKYCSIDCYKKHKEGKCAKFLDV